MRNSAKYIPHQACHNQSFHQCHHQVLALFESLTWKESTKFVYMYDVHQNAALYDGKPCLRSVSSMFFLEAVS